MLAPTTRVQPQQPVHLWPQNQPGSLFPCTSPSPLPPSCPTSPPSATTHTGLTRGAWDLLLLLLLRRGPRLWQPPSRHGRGAQRHSPLHIPLLLLLLLFELHPSHICVPLTPHPIHINIITSPSTWPSPFTLHLTLCSCLFTLQSCRRAVQEVPTSRPSTRPPPNCCGCTPTAFDERHFIPWAPAPFTGPGSRLPAPSSCGQLIPELPFHPPFFQLRPLPALTKKPARAHPPSPVFQPPLAEYLAPGGPTHPPPLVLTRGETIVALQLPQ